MIEKFEGRKVLIIGDIMLDRYVWGTVNRVSPEAPIPIVDAENETETLGGAANVAHNIASLGADPILCGVIGADTFGGSVLNYLAGLEFRLDNILIDSTRPTTVKTRVVGNNQQIVRFDTESRTPINVNYTHNMVEFVKEYINKVDIIVISDYGKGVVSAGLMHEVSRIADDQGVTVIVDPQKDNFKRYRGVDIITPNKEEAGYYCGFKIRDKESLKFAANKILKEIPCGYALITLGKDGMALFHKGGKSLHIPATAKSVFDVSGAGDTVVGVLALGLAAGEDIEDAASMANKAAGVAVGKMGTAVVLPEELE
jgi:D-beta-D-heptose 7-phosphate kinase/D-beta-D-heptose 1-phosphate adenosyltransferase